MRRTTRVSAVLWLCVVLSSAAFAGVPQVTLPTWMNEAAARPKKSYEVRTNAVVLLDDRTINVTRSGEYITTVRRVVRILRAEGKNESRISIAVDAPDALLNAHAWCSSPDGHNYEVKQKEFARTGFLSNAIIFEEWLSYNAAVPGGNPGAVVAFEYSVRERAWGDYTTWRIQEDIPLEETRLTLVLPQGWKHKEYWVNAAPVEPTAIGSTEQHWLLRDIPALDKEEIHAPGLVALAGRVQLSFSPPDADTPVFAAWKSIGKWSEDLAQSRRQPSPEIAEKVHQLTVGATSFDDIVSRLAAFVQRDIRYAGIEIGIGGFQPHAAAEVFRKRYGDCKDKATLLSSMLQVVGIRAENLLVDTHHGVVREDAPGNDFNHAISAIELPSSAKGNYHSVVQARSGLQYLIFDPTNEWIPLGELPEYEQGNYALLMGAAGGELIRLPVASPEENSFSRSGKFTLSSDGSVSGELQVISSGSHAWPARARLSHESELDRTKIAESFLSRWVEGASLKRVEFSDVDQLNRDFTVHYFFNAPGLLKSSGSLLLLKPCVFGHKAIRIDWKTRKYPVDLRHTSDEVDSYELTLPLELEVEDLPDTVNVDVGFAAYKSQIASVDGVIRYRREYIVRDPQIGIEKLPQFRKLEDAIMRDESASVVLKKKG